MVKRARPARGPRGPYVIDDRGTIVYDGGNIHRALALMKKASDKAKLYRLDEGEEGVLERVLLAFRKGVPAPTAVEPAPSFSS